MPDVYVAKKPESKKKTSSSKKKAMTQTHEHGHAHVHKRGARDYSEVMRRTKVSSNPFSSFMAFPQGFSVNIQDPNEEILLLVRKHPITNLKWILIAVLMSLAPIALHQFPGFPLLPGRFQFMTGVFWYLLVVAVVIEGFLNWYFDAFVVTDERVIDIDFINLIHKTISTAKIDDIQDVNMSAGGVLASLLEYGTVFIQTAAEVPEFAIANTPNPDELVKLINELILEEEQEQLDGRTH